MAKKVKSRKYSNIHYYAQCSSCSWDCGIGKDKPPSKVRSEIAAHVKSTGHTVTLETGSSIDYSLEE